MAEGGVKEMAKAYQTATKKMCELCLDEDSFKQATWYCKQCRQRLCDKCRKYHMKVASVKDHEVMRTEEMPPAIPQSTEELSDELRPPMCSTHNLPIELYCEDHNQPVCNSCKLVDHRKCKRLRDLEHVATENTGKSNEILQHLEDIDRGLSKTEDAITKESQSMEEQKQQIIQKIRNKMQEIEALGHKKISEVETMMENEQKSLQKENDGIKQTQLLVSKSIEEIKTAIRTGSEEELFIATNHAEKEAGKYQDILNDTSHVTHREVDFEVDSRLTDIDSFGKVDLNTCKVDVDLEPSTVEYIHTSSSVPISWFDVLPGEQVIALHCDTSQSIYHLSLYSRSTGLLSQLDLPDAAMSADTLNDHQVIVAIPHKQCLLMVDSVNNKLVQKDTIQTKAYPYLILKYSEQSVLAVVQHTDGKFFFQILDLRGNIQTNISINVNLMNTACIMMSKDRDIIYMADVKNGCYGFNLNGDTLFHYTKPNAEQYVGFAVDHHDCVYIAIQDQEGDQLAKFSPTGQRLQCIGRGYGIPLRCDKNKLYVIDKNVQNEWVINFIYV